MKLNIGCGPYYAVGWTNLELPGIPAAQYRCDIQADIRDLYRDPDSPALADIKDLEAVYMGHFLEHLTLDEIVLTLPALAERMLPGAPLAVVGPDVVRATRMHIEGKIPESLLELCHKHLNPVPGHSHEWDCDEKTVVRLLRATGFVNIQPIDLAHVSALTPSPLHHFPVVAYDAWQCAVIAEAPAPPKPKMAQPR